MDNRHLPATTAERSPRARHHRPAPARPDGRPFGSGPPGPAYPAGRPGPRGPLAPTARPGYAPGPVARPVRPPAVGPRPPVRPPLDRRGPAPLVGQPHFRPPAVAPLPPGHHAVAPPAPGSAGRHREPHTRLGGLVPLAAGALAAALPAVPALVAQAPPEAAPTTLVLQAAEPEPVAGARSALIAPFSPVPGDAAPEQPQLRVSDLVKAAGLADAAQQRVERESAARCDADLDGLGAVKPWVRDGARFLSCLYDEPTLHGVASRGGNYSDHPSGHAVDLMTGRERGDRIAACALDNQDELGVDYVIWRQRVNYGDGWEPMADRGGATANHFDHVHISFERSSPDGDPSAGSCD